jgi:hypothetical protein
MRYKNMFLLPFIGTYLTMSGVLQAMVHCAYRMSYMSNRALVTRLNAISRSAKRTSYEKLLVFYYSLEASGLSDLAQVARRTLEKLGAMPTS